MAIFTINQEKEHDHGKQHYHVGSISGYNGDRFYGISCYNDYQ